MNVNFDIIRKKLIKDYNDTVSALNGSHCSDADMDRIVIPVEDLRLYIERLRLDIVTIGALYDHSIDDCSCVINSATEVKEFLPGT